MVFIHKIVFYVIGEDGEAFAWEDDLSTAAMHCRDGKALRIEKVTHYRAARETVWSAEQGWEPKE